MEATFWHERWARGEIGFHEERFHPLLVRYWAEVSAGARGDVFVPLAGKSRDMLWLRDAGHGILGVELSTLAIEQFFAERGLAPEIDDVGKFARHAAGGYRLLAGDFFDLDHEDCAQTSLFYDRAALIALPEATRALYAEHLRRCLQPGSRGLLITLDYPQGAVDGPPFSVTGEEVRRLFGSWCDVRQLAREPSTVKGVTVQQSAWQLTVQSLRLRGS